MKFQNPRQLWLVRLVSLISAILAFQLISNAQTGAGDRHNAAGPGISIVGVPHAGKGGPDQTEPISGTAKGVNFATHKIVIYTFAGGTWWVQPTVAEPFTDIDQNGKWQTVTHLGSTYAALLVKPTYKPPATMNSVPKVGADVLVVTLVAGLK